MAGANSKEAKYRAWLEAAGVWQEGFEAAVHDLCVLERRKARAMAEWDKTAPKGSDGKKTGSPSVLDPLHDAILELEQEIYKQREGLGLTAKGLRRLKPPEEKLNQTMEIQVVFEGGGEEWAQ